VTLIHVNNDTTATTGTGNIIIRVMIMLMSRMFDTNTTTCTFNPCPTSCVVNSAIDGNSEEAITNIFSYAKMADKYRIIYADSSNEDAFVVHISDTKQVRFTRLGNYLYVYKPPMKNNLIKAQLLNIVEENKNFYTQRQFDRAKQARDLYHALGTPSINDFKAMMRMNSITKNPITTEDIQIAEKIFGGDIGSIKGKRTHCKPAPVVNDYVKIPNELIATQQNVTLCMDGIKMNGVAFLTTVLINLQYWTAQFVKHQTIMVHCGALKELFRIYNTGGFRITMI
jgi:hypothetical protein